jgi:hypothetical protein
MKRFLRRKPKEIPHPRLCTGFDRSVPSDRSVRSDAATGYAGSSRHSWPMNSQAHDICCNPHFGHCS